MNLVIVLEGDDVKVFFLGSRWDLRKALRRELHGPIFPLPVPTNTPLARVSEDSLHNNNNGFVRSLIGEFVSSATPEPSCDCAMSHQPLDAFHSATVPKLHTPQRQPPTRFPSGLPPATSTTIRTATSINSRTIASTSD